MPEKVNCRTKTNLLKINKLADFVPWLIEIPGGVCKSLPKNYENSCPLLVKNYIVFVRNKKHKGEKLEVE